MAWATYRLILPSQTTIEGPQPTKYCWNRVVESDELGLHWANGCNTADTQGDEICAQVVTKLNVDQQAEYQGWMRAGKPDLIGC